MEPPHLILLILLVANNFLIQGLLATNSNDKKLTLERRLDVINKPARKSFRTEYGDILDCVDINKQFAFDHPLLKNHSIQMKPTTDLRSSKLPMPYEFLPKNMRCPEGTVPVKRIQKEDLLMDKFSTLFSTSNDVFNISGQHEVAAIIAPFKNMGVSGIINIWNPQVKPDQFSAASIYVASADGPVSNVVQSGWMVAPTLYQNSNVTRLYAYWTKDSGKSTGCFNNLCPGFVQISKTVYLGSVITPVSTTFGDQYFLDYEIRQDIRTKNWWLYCHNGEAVGYWPVELFSTLASAGTRAGWGGETYSPPTEEGPEMGSGGQGNGGYTEVCLMKNLKMLAPQLFPQPKELQFSMTSPTKYIVTHDFYGEWENFIYFGGPRKVRRQRRN